MTMWHENQSESRPWREPLPFWCQTASGSPRRGNRRGVGRRTSVLLLATMTPTLKCSQLVLEPLIFHRSGHFTDVTGMSFHWAGLVLWYTVFPHRVWTQPLPVVPFFSNRPSADSTVYYKMWLLWFILCVCVFVCFKVFEQQFQCCHDFVSVPFFQSLSLPCSR